MSKSTSIHPQSKISLLVVLGGILLFIGLADFLIIMVRQLYLNSYDSRGIVTEAIVTRKYTQEPAFLKQYYIDYEFEYKNQENETVSFVRKEHNVGKDFYESVNEGSFIQIRYLQDELNNAQIERLVWRPNSYHTIRAIGFLLGGIVMILFAIKR